MYAKVRILLLVFLLSRFRFWANRIGTVTGTVTDPSGAVIRARTSWWCEYDEHATHRQHQRSRNLYEYPSLLTQQYTITITATGFKDKILEKLELTAFPDS